MSVSADKSRQVGVLSTGVWLPRARLDRATIASIAGGGGGRGTRTVASYDEDTTTMAVEAGRRALRDCVQVPQSVWLATTAPPYADRTNATGVHAALQLSPHAGAYDLAGSTRAVMAALRAGCAMSGPTLVIGSDMRTGLPGSGDEAYGGDGAAALLVGAATSSSPILAGVVGWGCVTDEFVDRWRSPGDRSSKVWEDRFGERHYVEAGLSAYADALKTSGLADGDIAAIAITGPHQRAVGSAAKALGGGARLIDDLTSTVGHTGTAHPLLLAARWLEVCAPGEVLALVSLADGADVVVLRATEAVHDRSGQRRQPVQTSIDEGTPLAYQRYLMWRGMLAVEPPRRPEPGRVSASAATRTAGWKFGFVGSRNDNGDVHLPPHPEDPNHQNMAGVRGRIVTFTIDRLSYSQSPPVVFAVVDFDGGGRLPIELTDVDLDQVHIGAVVEPTFRRLHSSDGIHNYFWKGRLVPANSLSANSVGDGTDHGQ